MSEAKLAVLETHLVDRASGERELTDEQSTTYRTVDELHEIVKEHLVNVEDWRKTSKGLLVLGECDGLTRRNGYTQYCLRLEGVTEEDFEDYLDIWGAEDDETVPYEFQE